jgi:hypothetical protein
MLNNLYRCLSKESYSSEIKHHKKTKRLPNNVPYFVDNIWEWLRPDNMPTRRLAVYASAHKSLALKFATSDDLLCKIRFADKANIVQIGQYQDAKLHPDVKKLPRLVTKYLGQSWLDSDLTNKKKYGQLFLPLLSRNETDSLLSIPELHDLKSQIINTSTFWHDVNHVISNYQLTDGELFFYADDGYYLDIEEK